MAAASPVLTNKLLYSRAEVCQLTGLSLRFVDHLIAIGSLRVKRVGARVLISRAELLRFLELEGVTDYKE